MMKKRVDILIACVLAAFLAGCASSPPSRFYTLSPASAPAGVPQANYSVSVGPVLVPAVVDRPQIVVRTGPNTVLIDQFDRWASPLQDDIGRVVAENLIAMLGTTRITLFPKSAADDASYRAAIDILRFDSEPGKAATLDALWKVSSANQGPVRQGRTTVDEPVQGGDCDALVAAHSRALGRLSAEIAAAIRELESRKP
jgi:uncharacterized lipoprotein YmbA